MAKCLNLTFNSGGTDADDRLHGDAGNDLLVGEEGTDHLFGDWGNDVMFAWQITTDQTDPVDTACRPARSSRRRARQRQPHVRHERS